MKSIFSATSGWARWKSVMVFLGGVALIGASSWLLQHVWRENGLRAVQAINEQRVQLVANAVKAEISRQDHLPVVLALDPDVRRTLHNPTEDNKHALSRKLELLSREADTRALYIIDANGVIIASDDWNTPDSLLNRNYADRPYFTRAVREGKGNYLGVDPANDRVRYYISERILDPELIGVAVVRVEFDPLETSWERAGEQVLVTDRDGIVFLASNPVLKYRRLDLPSRAPVREPPADIEERYPHAVDQPVSVETVEHHGSNYVLRVNTADEEESYSYRSLLLPDYGWTIHRLADMESVRQDQRDGAIIGFTLSALVISLLLYLLQRHRAYLSARAVGTLLAQQVTERTHELREANESLRIEIDERRRTEVRLRAAQNELVQASKLAALGQMSAAIAHEINQPLAAIRTFMASTRIFMQRGDTGQVTKNLDIVNDLAERMAKITAHLKTFARRSDPGRPELVLVDKAVEGALFLVDARIRGTNVRIEKAIEPGIQVRGYAVQLEQVLVNLVGNAIDALSGRPDPWLGVRVALDRETVSITIADNGPGFAEGQIERAFDPFFTTKPIGKGLGLGLSISYGIVQDFGGRISARNRAEGGAELTVELSVVATEAAPLAKMVHA